MYVIEHYHPLFSERRFCTSSGATTNINVALSFPSGNAAKKLLKEHDALYGGLLKVHKKESSKLILFRC